MGNVLQFRGRASAKTGKRNRALIEAERKTISAVRQGGGLTKITPTRAKVIEPVEFPKLIKQARLGKHGVRDEAIVRLSVGCGLRMKEISCLQWERNILDARGRVGRILYVTRDTTKGGENSRTVEREIPINNETREALVRLRHLRANFNDKFVIYPLGERSGSKACRNLRSGQCSPNSLVQYMRRLYKDCGFTGCTSHSGRRTFGTILGRRVNEVGGNIRDVQLLLGHRSLETTQGYMEPLPRLHSLVGLLPA